MRIVLKERTNKQTADKQRENNSDKEGSTINKPMAEKDMVLKYLQDVTNKTSDLNLKYDLNKCVEILEGKENQEFTELKDALEEVIMENELLFKEKCELAIELDFLKSKSEE